MNKINIGLLVILFVFSCKSRNNATIPSNIDTTLYRVVDVIVEAKKCQTIDYDTNYDIRTGWFCFRKALVTKIIKKNPKIDISDTIYINGVCSCMIDFFNANSDSIMILYLDNPYYIMNNYTCHQLYKGKYPQNKYCGWETK